MVGVLKVEIKIGGTGRIHHHIVGIHVEHRYLGYEPGAQVRFPERALGQKEGY